MSDPKKNYSDVYRYSSAGIQMVLIICIFTYLGTKLDSYFETQKPLWTAGLSLFGVIVSVIYMVKAIGKISNKGKNDKKKP